MFDIFCNLESTCCNSAPKQPKPPKQKKVKKEKPKKGDAAEKADGKEGKAEAKGSGKDKEKTGKPSPYQVHNYSLPISNTFKKLFIIIFLIPKIHFHLCFYFLSQLFFIFF